MYHTGDAGAVDYEPDEDDGVPETAEPTHHVEEEDDSVEDADIILPADAMNIASTTPAPKTLASRLVSYA